MLIDARAVEPFNTWWRTKNHCESSPVIVEAFAAGFKAGMTRAVSDAVGIINSSPSEKSSSG